MFCHSLCRAPSPAAAAATRFLSPSPLPRRRSAFSSATGIRMSSQFVEHVVLFNVKDDTHSSSVDAMVSSLSSLRSLDTVLHLTVGPIHTLRSPPPPRFTHMLHSRYRTKDDLAAYSGHPDHLGVVRQNVLPICEDILAVDWISPDLDGPVSPPPGSAMRLQLVKLKEGAEGEGKEKVLGVIGGLKEKIGGGINQITFGDNFSPARAKGFSICSIGFLPSLDEIDKLEGNVEIEKEKDKVRGYLDGLIVADFVVPSAQSASL